MRAFTDRYTELFKRLLPSPFSIALLLTFFVFVLAYVYGENFSSSQSVIVQISNYWYDGLWNTGGMKFSVQMMLMLLLGHIIALSSPVNSVIEYLSSGIKSTEKAVIFVSFFTILVSLFNWGLGLIFGAVFTQKIGEITAKKNIKINFPLIGAAGYSGLMVWHGGLSGSAPIKAADKGHISSLVSKDNFSFSIPDSVSVSETIFSYANITVSLLLLVIVPVAFYYLSKLSKSNSVQYVNKGSVYNEKKDNERIKGAERIDNSVYFGQGVGILILIYAVYKALYDSNHSDRILPFLTPDYINFTLLGLALLTHKTIAGFLTSVDMAISGISGILLQFPLYFGIMGVMKETGLISSLSLWFSDISNENTFPVLTFISSGLLNVFVPSGGGQWAVQGPIIIETALKNNIPLGKCIMAMAYGDQLTNMLQPFWALPLLGITGLKAKQILPYTLVIMLVGGTIFLSGILFLWG